MASTLTVSEVHRARDLLFAHCEPDDLTVVSVLRGWLDRGDKPGVSSGPAVSRNGFGAAHVQSPLVILLDACTATRPVSALQIHSKADRPIGSTCRPWRHPRNYGNSTIRLRDEDQIQLGIATFTEAKKRNHPVVGRREVSPNVDQAILARRDLLL